MAAIDRPNEDWAETGVHTHRAAGGDCHHRHPCGSAAAGQVVCLNNGRQIGLAASLYTYDTDGRLPLCQNWGRAWGRDHALRRDSVWMPELLEPYIGKNTGAPRPGQRRQPRLPQSVFACPVGVRTDDMRVAWMGKLFVRNDHVTYVWNHIYLKKVRNTYEVQRPVSGCRASDCVSPSTSHPSRLW